MSYVLVVVFCLAVDRPQVECFPEQVKVVATLQECSELASRQAKTVPNGALVCVPLDIKS